MRFCLTPFEHGKVINVFPPDCVNVVNIVAKFNLGSPIDLKQLLKRCEFACVRQFVAVTLRHLPPKVMASVFNSGNVNIIGSTSPLVARDFAESFKNVIRDTLKMPELSVNNFYVSNYTAVCVFPFTVNLSRFIENEPQAVLSPYFPVVNYKSKGSRIDWGISSTCLRITGTKTEVQNLDTYSKCRALLEQYALQPGEDDPVVTRKRPRTAPAIVGDEDGDYDEDMILDMLEE